MASALKGESEWSKEGGCFGLAAGEPEKLLLEQGLEGVRDGSPGEAATYRLHPRWDGAQCTALFLIFKNCGKIAVT